MRNLWLIFIFLAFTSVVHAEAKLTVLLDWFLYPAHAPLIVAEQQGFFKAAGLTVNLIGPADPADPPKLVAAGHADIAITYEPDFLEQVAQGLPLLRIGTLVNKPLNCLVVLKSSPLITLRDLKGKRVGYSSSGGINNVMLKTMLNRSGLNLSDIQHINVHYDLTQALLTQKVDAATGMLRTFEPIQMELAGQPARLFLPEKNGVPLYSELIFVIHKKNRHDPRIIKFLTALEKAQAYLQQHPTATWEQFSKTHPLLNNQLNRLAWRAMLPYFAPHPATFSAPEWLQFAHFMQANGLIRQLPPLQEYAVDLTKE